MAAPLDFKPSEYQMPKEDSEKLERLPWATRPFKDEVLLPMFEFKSGQFTN